MFTCEHLSLKIEKSGRELIKDLSFTVRPGDKLAVIGEEGNGKTSLFKAMAQPEEIQTYMTVEGKIPGSDEVIGYLPQGLDTRELKLSTEAFMNQKANWLLFDYAQYYQLLSEMAFSESRISSDILMSQLSGGEKIKLQLLCEMMKQPTVMLLDEPSNDLDIESVEWLEFFIQQLTIPVLFISHDETLLERCATMILHLEQLHRKTTPVHTLKKMTYAHYIIDRAEQLGRQTQKASKEKEEHESKMERHRQIYERVQHELRTVSRQNPSTAKKLKDKMRSVKSMGKRFDREKENMTEMPNSEEAILFHFGSVQKIPNGKTMIDYKCAQLSNGAHMLSQSIELTVTGSQKVCITGRNGSGKTTLLKSIMRTLDEQHVSYGYMPQNYAEKMDLQKTAVEFLTVTGDKEEHTRIRTFLGSMNLTSDEMLVPLEKLSGGQKAKLFYLKMIFEDNHLLILDEPTRNLSPLSGPEVREALRGFNGCILAVSHDRKFIDEVCERVYQLDKNGLKELYDSETDGKQDTF